MKIKSLLLLFLVTFFALAQTPQEITDLGLKTKQEILTTEKYMELPNPVATNLQNWSSIKGIHIGWGSTDIRYKKEEPILHLETTKHLKAWKGERISAQIGISNADKDIEISVEVSDLKSGKYKIGKEHFSNGFRALCNDRRTQQRW
ncbi:conserved exported hypothetical protein [Capnocytophaga canimorsus]|nr:hypothetical protein [Capnocytophaga canimorsus]CEN46692.1 conserved exported hypothetical protein [Capnocytophaga canimorsus]